jgi:hypothetical protein
MLKIASYPAMRLGRDNERKQSLINPCVQTGLAMRLC